MNVYSPSLRNAGRGVFFKTSSYICSSCSRRLASSNVVKENQMVMLKHRTNTSTPIITGKLRPGSSVGFMKDSIRHEDIIGKSLREVVGSRKRVLYRIHEPTLAEYTDHSPRLVTPIYSQDANLIVSLLDINPSPPRETSSGEDKFEIFEAGTGHGALTLHLARAIHASNTAPPVLPKYAPREISDGKRLELGTEESIPDSDGKMLELGTEESTPDPDGMEVQTATKEAYDEWRSRRGAVIHTLDISEKHSAHAETVVRNFRDGLYFPHVDFHVGTIEDYLSARLEENGQRPFLDHAILDLPATQSYLKLVGRALKAHGSLLVFCPSITQIIECIKFAKENKLPLFLEKTVEVGGAIGVGGREWAVRPVKPRSLLKTEEAEGEEASEATQDDGWEMVCRPKVGVRINGGGFVGQFIKEVEFPTRDVSVS